MESIVDWLEAHQLPCYYKQTLGVECLGCGMQTSLILLLRGNFIDSFIAYPPLIPVVLMIVFLIAHLIFKFNNGAKFLKLWFVFTLSVMIISYIIKHFNHFNI